MSTSGIVIVLARQPEKAAEAVQWLKAQEDLELGTAPADFPERLPAVLEGLTSETARDRLLELESHPSIQKIDVIHVGFDEADELPKNPFDRPGRRSAARGTHS